MPGRTCTAHATRPEAVAATAGVLAPQQSLVHRLRQRHGCLLCSTGTARPPRGECRLDAGRERSSHPVSTLCLYSRYRSWRRLPRWDGGFNRRPTDVNALANLSPETTSGSAVIPPTKHEAVRIGRRLILIAMRKYVDVSVLVLVTFAQHVLKRRVLGSSAVRRFGCAPPLYRLFSRRPDTGTALIAVSRASRCSSKGTKAGSLEMNRTRGLLGHTTPSADTVRMFRVTQTGGRVWIASQLSAVRPGRPAPWQARTAGGRARMPTA